MNADTTANELPATSLAMTAVRQAWIPHRRHGEDARLGAPRGGAHAIGHDLPARLAESRAMAVHSLVPSMEVADELGERGFVEHPCRHRHLDLVDLALVADVGRAREARIRNS